MAARSSPHARGKGPIITAVIDATTRSRSVPPVGPGLIVHEWVERRGGAERVLEAMTEAFADADVRVLWSDCAEVVGRPVSESWLARTPLRRHKVLALPAMLPTWRLPVGTSREWVLVSSHLFAHHVRTSGPTRKLVYAHTPARYIWEPDRDGRGSSLAARTASLLLKPIDRLRAAEASSIAVNSLFTGQRVRDAWHQPSRVIYPPVNTELLSTITDWRSPLDEDELRLLDSLARPFILGASRFVPYKRLEKVMDAGARTGLPVVIAGHGPWEARLRAYAEEIRADVTFVISPSDQLIRALYAQALVYVFPAVEDFGIMPVEAMACGTPVIGTDIGGVRESVSLAGGGVIADLEGDPDWSDLLRRALALDVDAFRARTRVFSRRRFIAEIQDWVAEQTA
ncbi:MULTISPECIES: glycosyltransferase [unclassified Rathayibacter]|uniref:glycosyltransferase n=1 Tax=unclassified Rathayibacter TaxID=2609250 RepID=UPI000CE90FC6|nr:MULTISPECIES: glycosyltransferase [unclassified Rathayibacter]PPG08662.1 glycosyltransferase family 4 protein [Rathayibacter sp. AY2B1]PPG74038.1 glycosyltransferase family 4 protein [Rathayibacter sp. AY1F4]